MGRGRPEAPSLPEADAGVNPRRGLGFSYADDIMRACARAGQGDYIVHLLGTEEWPYIAHANEYCGFCDVVSDRTCSILDHIERVDSTRVPLEP